MSKEGRAGAPLRLRDGSEPASLVTRREVLGRLSLALGGTISAPIIGAALSCGRPAPEEVSTPPAPWAPQTLDAEQNELVIALTEAILPATDTPGAKEALVNQFIDLLLTDWLDGEERDRFLAGLAALDASCHEQFGASFQGLEIERQMELLKPLDIAGVEARARGEEPLPFFATLKEMTLVGYYTSEIGMTQELRYGVHFPAYEGCTPLGPDGRSWQPIRVSGHFEDA